VCRSLGREIELVSGQDRDDTGELRRRFGLNFPQHTVGDGAANEDRVKGLAGVDIRDEARLTGQQRRVFDSLDLVAEHCSGHDEEDKRMQTLRELLVEVAARGGTITYEQLRTELGLSGDLVPELRALSVAEDDAGRGLLTAVVVRRDTGRPGEGWFRLASQRGRDVADRDGVWRAERTRLQGEHAGR
jgi:hypothetical protein